MQRKRTRANGEGSIYWSDAYNRYIAQVTIGRDAEGKLRRKKFFGQRGDRSRAARVGVEERARPYLRRRTARPSSESLQTYVDRWITNAPVRANTRDYYGWSAKHLGSLGSKPLVELEPIDIRRHIDGLKIGPRMRRAVYSLLHRVLREAAQLELITRNPAASVTPPKMPKREMHALTPAEVGFLLETVRGDRLEALVILALTSTMGPAEMLALRRKDVQLAGGYVWVTGDLVATSSSGYRPTIETTKTARRRRRIDLPKVAVEALRERMKLCLTEGSGEFVFTTAEGGLIRLNALRRYWWKPLVERAADLAKKKRASFPRDLRLYDLRHTANALMGLAGVPIEIARDRMGHASIKTTADVYGHIYATRQTDAVERLDKLFATLVPHPLPHDRSTGNVRGVKKR
jgi:integrase